MNYRFFTNSNKICVFIRERKHGLPIVVLLSSPNPKRQILWLCFGYASVMLRLCFGNTSRSTRQRYDFFRIRINEESGKIGNVARLNYNNGIGTLWYTAREKREKKRRRRERRRGRRERRRRKEGGGREERDYSMRVRVCTPYIHSI